MLTDRFHQALVFAARLHATQQRKGDGNTPYIAHLLAVCAIVLENGGDEEEAIAALLHDAVEDQGGAPTLDKIRQAFGGRVAAIVDACSDTDETPKPPWRQRKEAYLAHLPQATPSARLVSAADKLHNARSILSDYHVVGEAIWDRFRGGKEGSLWYYRELVTVYSQVGPDGLAHQLARVVAEIEARA